ncbi:PA2169 family four-helix-bundle protein [Chryseobacterium echinoideorum]|uniref:PA2169 family four-helix-bundle protein n=1 Tax=Chryseobacterium echinoideorum TaxID=1549648 RepID=UPI0011858BEB|nr:PA2169 family four-helix-bundle protein [Chryseobacterium echinoideorum]
MEKAESVNILNDLLQITNDRIKGFEKVEGKVWENYSGLKGEYDRMISHSKMMKNEIINLITERGGNPNDSTTVAGNLHRTWIDIKNSLPTSNKDIETLQNVVFGEKNALKIYDEALKSGDLDNESHKIISDQLNSLQVSYQQFSEIEKYKSKED